MVVVVSRDEFFIINISKRNVVLTDLYITVPKMKTVNLLSKHYHFTLEQLIKSATSGSLYKKRDKIWLRNGDLKKEIEKIKIEENILKSRSKSSYVFEPITYDELLDVSDKEYVSEQLDDEINV